MGVFGPRDWFSRLRLELECLKMASVGEKLGIEAESAEFAVGHQICCLVSPDFQALGDGVGGLRRKSVVKNEVRKHENVCFERFSCVLSLGNVIFGSASTS